MGYNIGWLPTDSEGVVVIKKIQIVDERNEVAKPHMMVGTERLNEDGEIKRITWNIWRHP